MIIQAHRGYKLRYPENTLPAYYGAIEAGFDFIELDTKFTKDNVCILIHDRKINRTGRRDDGSKFEEEVMVADLTLEEIRKIDFGLHKGEEFRGTKVPTLDELISFVRETKMPIKFDNVLESATKEQIDSVLDAVKASGVEECVGFTAKDIEYVEYVTSKLQKCVIHYDGPTSAEIYEKLSAAAKGHKLFIWLPSEPKSWLTYPVATAADVIEARKYGKVGLWTAHDEASLDYIMSLKPDALEVDGTVTVEMVRAREI